MGWRLQTALARGGERWRLPTPLGENVPGMSFLELPFRAGFDTVPGRAVERGGKGWRTADAVRLYSHYPLGLGEADTQCLSMSNFVDVCREIVDTANAIYGSVGARWLHGGCMSVCLGGTDFVVHPPPLMPILGRGRRHVLGCRGMQKMSRCC